MSWADENLDWGGEDYIENEIVLIRRRREELWRKGIHIDKNGKEHKISEMTDDHLLNTINYFSDLNIAPLQRELDKRLLNN